jgi:chaperonin GroES
MSFKPLQDYVLIKRRDVAEAQYGGIIIPDTAKDKPQEGEVLAVGPGKRLDGGGGPTMAVAVGNTVLFGKYAGTEIKMNGEDLLVMRESDILGILDA